MKTIAFSIKGLLTAVTMIAVGLFALMNATYVWSSVVLSFTLLLLLIALVAIVYRRGESRAFWVGFAIFGWGYFVFTYLPLEPMSQLPSHFALPILFRAIYTEHSLENGMSFYRIFHCLFASLLAMIGGFLARHFYLAQESRSRALE